MKANDELAEENISSSGLLAAAAPAKEGATSSLSIVSKSVPRRTTESQLVSRVVGTSANAVSDEQSFKRLVNIIGLPLSRAWA